MDATYLQRFLSDSSRVAKRSEIRELLKVIANPEVISFAGGLPSPFTFPLEELAQLLPDVVRQHGEGALQYGPTEGNMGLRQEILRLMEEEGVPDLSPDQILITSASQQGLDLVSRAFVAPGDAVICGLPSYLGALSAFTACGASLCGVPLDDGGMRTDLLEQRLVELRRENVRPKFLYVVPDFQNPASATLSARRRLDLLAIARDFDLLVVEDSPYRQLRYEGDPLPTLVSLDRDGRVISLYTFSKVLFPGLRLGWIVADASIIDRLVVTKQPVDLCTSPFAQVVAREYVKTKQLAGNISRAREIYRRRLGAFLAALEEHIDPAWGLRWTRPEGGFFVWMELPPNRSAAELLSLALEQNVAFVTGTAFHCDGSGHNTLRLNFSYPTVDQIQVGVRRLARAIETLIQKGSVHSPDEIPTVKGGADLLTTGEHALDYLPLSLAVSEIVE